MEKISVKKLTVLAVLLALCIIGANIKFLGSIALDSFPALLGAALLGPVAGAFLGIFGHMVSALLAGFPLTLPIHIMIGLIMGLTMLSYGYVRKRTVKPSIKQMLLSDLVAYIFNVPVSMVCLLMFMPKEAIMPLLVPLTIATIVNLVIADLVYLAFPSLVKQKLVVL